MLKLRRDEPLSNFAFKFNLRRYNLGLDVPEGECWMQVGEVRKNWENGKGMVAWAYTRPLLSST